jgi:DNA polymerase-3 subunit chi
VTEVLFYRLQRQRLDEVLPDLLEKTLRRGWRAVVVAGSVERVEALNAHLWTWRRDSFLPHGSKADGFAADQPVWLTDGDENPNGAKVLFLVDGAEYSPPSAAAGSYERVCDLFDGNDPAAVEAARERWTRFKNAGHALSYWRQGDSGWEKQAEV